MSHTSFRQQGKWKDSGTRTRRTTEEKDEKDGTLKGWIVDEVI